MSYLLFIDDPPTAEIYSLSLHDALPISVVSRAARGLADYLLNTLSLAEPLVVIGFDARNGSRSFAERSAAIMTDRKSTRLNSSHVAISYAVFCLKKKT